jgi:3-oxoacyl-[acyl-carrier protein] reductase
MINCRAREWEENMPAPTNMAVIVTGAARGMGRAMTLSLASAGVRVAAADLPSSGDAMKEVIETARRNQGSDRNIAPVECDIKQWDDCTRAVRTAVERFGAVHGVVNNAGIAIPDEELLSGRVRRRRFYEHDVDAWRHVIDTNINGTFRMAKAIAPTLVAQGWGRIINVTTSYTTMMLDGFSPYGPSKAALEAATVIWAKDLAGTGVTANVLMPGGAGNTRMVPATEYADRSKLVQPEMMMAPIAWLMSAQSDGVTGRRFNASLWDPKLPAAAAAAMSGTAAGW